MLRITGLVMKKIAAWNVRGMFQSGKIRNVAKEMKRINIETLGTSEMRWPNSGECHIHDHYVNYSGNDDADHYNGVALIVSAEIRLYGFP